MPPPLCFGDAREATVGDLSSRACRGTTPLAKHSERSVEHTPRIEHQALSSNQLCKSEYVEISLSLTLFPIETESGIYWAKPGFTFQREVSKEL